VEKYLELSRDWEAAGLASRVSEVNLDDLRDVRAQLTGDDSRIEVRLGKDDLTKRLKDALEKLDIQRNAPGGAAITYIDMTQGKRAVFGFNPQAVSRGNQASGESAGATDVAAHEATTSNVAADASRRAPEEKKAAAKVVNKSRPSAEKQAKSKETQKHEARDTTGQTRGAAERPRRVGRG
ncbi:MAG TPA: cell division protein FtsQ/DivIB, partial [Pyrinomonadaceae bacterium]|nr:cell division protein FtsQ/DivIB [Pyrinomonadaceae bacterium]